jgi:hypothetical protein
MDHQAVSKQEVKKVAAVYITHSRSQVLVDLATSKQGEELVQEIKSLFADDLRKALGYANKNLSFSAIALEIAITQLGFKIPAKLVTETKKEKYTKKLEVTFHKAANADYRAFILAYLDKEGICISTKGDVYVYTFLPDKFERTVVKMKPLVNVTTAVII